MRLARERVQRFSGERFLARASSQVMDFPKSLVFERPRPERLAWANAPAASSFERRLLGVAAQQLAHPRGSSEPEPPHPALASRLSMQKKESRAQIDEASASTHERRVELEARRKASCMRLKKDFHATADHFKARKEQREKRRAAWLKLPLEQRQAMAVAAAERATKSPPPGPRPPPPPPKRR